jgi:hypothetical protein
MPSAKCNNFAEIISVAAANLQRDKVVLTAHKPSSLDCDFCMPQKVNQIQLAGGGRSPDRLALSPGGQSAVQPREDTADHVVKDPRLRALVHYWNSKCGPMPMPSWQQIDPIEIPQVLPIVLVVDVTPGGLRVRLLGTDTTAAFGGEMRGKMINEFQLGDFTPVWLEAFSRPVKTGSPTSAVGRFSKGTSRFNIEMVLLPLSDDGLLVKHILGALLIWPLRPGSGG